MANEYINHLVINGVTKLDLRSDTVTPSALAEGYTAHDRSGALITGTATGGSMVIRDEQDSHGGTIRHITAGSVVQGTKTITENGTYDVAAFADASVNVPAPEPELQAKTATPSTSQQTITADSGYDGLSQVTVSAMPSGSATTPTTSITANPSISVNSSTGLITASVSGSKSVTPSVSAGYVSSGTAGTVSVRGSNTSQLTTQAAKTVTPSTSAQTAVAAGRYTTGAVTVAAMPSGTAGTPTATKGSVSNHAVTVTPSVTNTTGYIAGGTKTGTAVSVSASELVSGTLSITENGTYDVTQYAGASVEVSAPEPSGVKYVYSDLEDSAADVAGYKYCSYDFAPVGDNKARFWIEVDGSDLTFTAPVTVPMASAYRYTGMIDWGDGSEQTAYAYGNTDHTHTYDSAGRYCVSTWWTGGAEVFDMNDVAANDRPKVIAIEAYWWNYPTNTLQTNLTNVRKLRFSSQQTAVTFGDYRSLTDVVLPDSVTTIENCYRCYSLERLTIPSSVTRITALSNNTAMKEYHLLPTTPPSITDRTFTAIPSDCVIYVPSASLTAYQTAENWSAYASQMVGE